MKLLITGATGFIGTNLAKKLLTVGHEIHAIIRPTTDINKIDMRIKTHTYNGSALDLVSYMKKENFDGVIHLASLFLTQHQEKDIDPLIESNITFSTKLLEASIQSNVTWFLNTGTFWQHYKNKSYSPVNLYAATKQAFQDISRYYYETSNLIFVTVKLFGTFGPSDTRPKVFNLWTKISKTGEQLDMSPGGQIVDINYIGNIVDGYIQMIHLLSRKEAVKFKGKEFAIPSRNRMTLKKLAHLFEKIAKVKLNINWGMRPYSSREVMNPWTRYNVIPGFKQKISLEQGLRETIFPKTSINDTLNK